MLWAILLTILYYIVIIYIDKKRQRAYKAKQNLIGQTDKEQQTSNEGLALFGEMNTATNTVSRPSPTSDISPTEISDDDTTTPNETKQTPKTSPRQALSPKMSMTIKTAADTDSNTKPSNNDITESVALLGQQLIQNQATDSDIINTILSNKKLS